MNNIDLPWDWSGVSRNPNVTLEHVMQHPNLSWCDIGLSFNKNIPISYLLKHCLKSHNYGFSLRADLKIAYIHNKTVTWWDYISENSSFTFDDMINNPDIQWNWASASANPNIVFGIIQQHPELPWDYTEFSRNPNVTFDLVMNNLDKPWHWQNLSRTIFF